MPKGFARSIARGNPQEGEVLKYRFRIDDDLNVDGLNDGFGNIPIGQLPEGRILFLGAAIHYRIDGSAESNLVAAWDGDLAVGIKGTVNAPLDEEESNIIQPDTIPRASGKIATGRGIHNSGNCGLVIDNTDDDTVVYLNMLVDNADISGDAVVRVTGILTMAFIVMGDD